MKGICEVVITEILGIDTLLPSDYDPASDVAPESWYEETEWDTPRASLFSLCRY